MMLIRTCYFLLLLLCSIPIIAQDGGLCCFYSLELSDSRGDGWNNASLNVTIGDRIESYTLNNVDDDGSFETFTIRVTPGDTISLTFNPGTFDFEISYTLKDSEGNEIFVETPDPREGLVFLDVASCLSCPILTDDYVAIEDVKAVKADINLLECLPGRTYIIEYDSTGFEPGTGQGNIDVISGGEVTLTGLVENSVYDFYASVICINGDTTNQVGPFTFQTLYKVDVGITNISTPETACDLGDREILTVTLQNFGANPLSLIPFNFSINGVEGGVPQPQDGYFTGVLGKDSLFVIEFETPANLGVAGEYEILAWTELEEDSDNTNDTTRLVVTNIPVITQYPYFTDFENWASGWTVDGTSENPSWEYGIPSSVGTSGAASGDFAWATGLKGDYNNRELSYLISPCLDFSSLVEDPIIAFSLNFQTESCCDEGWVEVSIDGGMNYTKVGEAGTGVNWYNDSEEQYWNGDGGFTGWVSAFNTLTGTAGASEVRVRFVMSSDLSVSADGFGIDDIFISPPLDNDLAALSVSNTSQEECGQALDSVVLKIANLGSVTQSGFDVGYQINGETPVIENVGELTLAPGEEGVYTFVQTFSSETLQTYEIKAFTALNTEEFVINDSTTFNFATAIPAPYVETFEIGALPNGWTVTDELFSVTDGHNAGSFVLFDNLWENDPNLEAFSPVIGPVSETDTLTFDYRFVNFDGDGLIPKIFIEGDSLNAYLSIDCGENYERVITINSSNHVATNSFRTAVIPLTDYAGEAIKIRFDATWAEGDYFVDIDNIRLVRCPGNFDLEVTKVDETANGEANGSATVVTTEGGLSPYTFMWSNGAATKTATGLSAGLYRVTVTDAVGCTDFAEVTIGIGGVGTEQIEVLEKVTIAPNPTSGLTQLNVEFTESVNLDIRVISLVGQVLFERSAAKIQKATYDIDLSNYAGGIYFVQMRVGSQMYTEKIVKLK